MKIRIYARPAAQHQVLAAQRFQSGLHRHGLDAPILDPRDDPCTCDLAVFWSHHQKHIIRLQQAAKARYLVMEAGYIGDRMYWTSLGFDGLNGRATFPPPGDDGERFLYHHGHLLHDWAQRRGPVALMGQVPSDAQVQNIPGGYERWLNLTAHALIEAGHRVIFRPHPKHQGLRIDGCETDTGTLSDLLARVSGVVAYNSNSAVDAVLAGVPTVVFDCGSMAWPVTAHSLHAIGYAPDRTEWAARLAWCQWAPHEIAEGLAWDHLRETMQ